MAATPEHAARVLGLSLDATLDDVRRVRRKMALKYHPDRSTDQARSTRHMARINAAADTLIAFLKKREAVRPQRGHGTAGGHSAHKGAGGSTARSKRNKTKTERQHTGAHPRQQEPRRDTNRQAAHAPGGPTKARVRSKAELARVFLATQSYGKVLSRIGGQSEGPRVDLRVMSFAKAS